MIYLDYNATAPLRPEVEAALDKVSGEALNPSSIHAQGKKARKLVEEARGKILNFINAEALIFCGSGTEANNLALHQRDKVIVSAIEHDSVYKSPRKIGEIKVDENGIVDLNHLQELLTSEFYPLVSVMLANNETGVIQPIKKIAKIVHQHGALLHCDAVQAFGKIPINFKELGVDLLTLSAHKVGGPVGAGALVYKKEIEIKPLMFGGAQEKNKRPGTENVAAIIGLAALTEIKNQQSDLRDYLETEIKKIAPEAIIFGEKFLRLPNTTCLSMPGVESMTQLIHFDTNGICISSGAACSSGKVEVSRVLKAMNAPYATCAIRVSTGWKTTKGEIDQFIQKWAEIYQRTKEIAA